MKKTNKKEMTFEQFSRAHKVISKKALIIGSICAGTVALGGAGAAVYFGVTRGSADNSISYDDANEFGRKNYILSEDFIDGKHNATSATLSWDFSKTDFNDTIAKKVWDEVFWANESQCIFRNVLSAEEYTKYSTAKPVKIEDAVANEQTRTYQSNYKSNPFAFFTHFTCKKISDTDKTIFYTDTHTNLKKSGDEITYTTLHTFTSEWKNNVTVTLNKNGTVKKCVFPIYGHLARSEGFYNASFTVNFTYNN